MLGALKQSQCFNLLERTDQMHGLNPMYRVSLKECPMVYGLLHSSDHKAAIFKVLYVFNSPGHADCQTPLF